MNQLAGMRTFVRLAELQSFTRTADSLGLSRSVVSAHGRSGTASGNAPGQPDDAPRRAHARMITCASPEYLRQNGVPNDPQQLRDHKLIGALSNQTRRAHRWVFQMGTTRKQLPFRFNVAFNSAEARIQAAVRGAGIVQSLDLLVAELLAANRLQAVLTDWSADGGPISIVYPAIHRESPKVRVFAAFAAFAAQLLEDYRLHVDRLLALRREGLARGGTARSATGRRPRGLSVQINTRGCLSFMPMKMETVDILVERAHFEPQVAVAVAQAMDVAMEENAGPATGHRHATRGGER